MHVRLPLEIIGHLSSSPSFKMKMREKKKKTTTIRNRARNGWNESVGPRINENSTEYNVQFLLMFSSDFVASGGLTIFGRLFQKNPGTRNGKCTTEQKEEKNGN